ncbi:cyclohexanone monooxygenase [Microdochium bolleyi]|uniref:Cyclohexanone monooxygenase n=1 Tax=Microdochium bolleyi TaxID=196109 RepID=A0A136J369_9PEZI|nr:cyclohexanone monooxygenase [Microdochium bolleyi]
MLDQWHSQPRNIRIVHIGAGATGLCAAFKMERQLDNYELVCYEKNEEVGGTWYENRYPGCACDVPAHIYTYTFEPNPNWSAYYAGSPEIQDYFVGFCDKYNLRKYIKLKHRVVGAFWHEDSGQWEVKVEHDGQTFTDWCHVLVNGSGLINRWKWPQIEGLHSFKGDLMHSAAWDGSKNWADKCVAVLGNGSSAIQIIPQIQKTASKLTSFMRGPTFITPPMQRIEVDLPEKLREAEMPQTVADPMVMQRAYTEAERKALAADPDHLLLYRKKIEYSINVNFGIFYKDTEASAMAGWYMRDNMKKRLKDHPVLTKNLIPEWAVGCRRLTPGDGYLEALVEPNVDFTFSHIQSIDEKGITTADGAYTEVDMIICATGFDMAWTPHFKLQGRDGVDIKDLWSPIPNCYLGLAAPRMPNYFVMNGPRGNLGNGTVLPCLETQLEYVIAAVKKMQSDRIKVLEVKETVTSHLNEYVDAWCETSVFSAPCRSWYKNNTTDGKPMVWGGSSMHYLKTIRTPRWEHWNMTYLDANPWAFLGNGRIKAETEADFHGMTPYLRNSDTPWTIV